MNRVKRIYSEKKEPFAVEAAGVCADIQKTLGIRTEKVRIFNRYDVEGISDDDFRRAENLIFSEPPVDNVYRELPDLGEDVRLLAVEFLPGQFDQRADSCAQCISLLTEKERPAVRSCRIYAFYGDLSDEQFAQIENYLINPVEARRASLELPETLGEKFDIPQTVRTIDGFIKLDGSGLADFVRDYALAMDTDDIAFLQKYFRDTEKRDPTLTEIRMIDTYWSDHCRHTTFLTRIDNVDIELPYVEKAYNEYLEYRKEINSRKPQTLMDIATIGGKVLRKRGQLRDLDVSEEINACSVRIKAKIKGRKDPEDYLLMFKNETHNHPTEIEPFGGAATCLGGAIRDPLSGRAYVYQAMRCTGAADPRTPFEKTLRGKLPQRKITTTAAAGYSSYGNQIGLATGLVNEFYHEGYVAKRLEIGAVVGAAPAENVIRLKPAPGDVVILLGGATGRDGCGGATGSSKSHTLESISRCGAEVQKGNPTEERKIQRLFRDSRVTRLIKRCNDFGAGGVSVAVGELADGLEIDLDKVPKKYEGLDGTELAISESQERMAVVVAAADAEKFIEYASAENLSAVKIATVTQQPRLRMNWKGNTIVDLSREFLNSNGAEKHTDVAVKPQPVRYGGKYEGKSFAEAVKAMVTDLNVCSQKGLTERFDGSIGAASVFMPFGGKYQLTPAQVMAAKIPVIDGESDTASVMAYGFDPYLSESDPFKGAFCAIVESITKLVAAGCDRKKVWLSLQEYFERTNSRPERWGKPFAALLGALSAQIGLCAGAIGGKDSMSGTFENIDVPPTLVSFAVSVNDAAKLVSPEFKGTGNVYYAFPEYDGNSLPDTESLVKLYDLIHSLISDGTVTDCAAVTSGGVCEAAFKMCLGNGYGFEFANVPEKDLFRPCYGGFVFRAEKPVDGVPMLGRVTAERSFVRGGEKLCMEELTRMWKDVLEPVFPLRAQGVDEAQPIEKYSFDLRSGVAPSVKIARPKVLIPAFPGTNCEYDSARAFAQAGAEPEILVIRNRTAADITETLSRLEKAVAESQILMFPGGFSGGDEPDGSGKFIATFFRNPRIMEAVNGKLESPDFLILGICNGFQALIKLGLVPYGRICAPSPEAPTLTYNAIGRHQSMMVDTRVASVNSPWMMFNNVGDIHTVPISHGEGRFIASDEVMRTLIGNGQIATQYVDKNGCPTMETCFNPNASVGAVEGIFSPDGRIFGKMAHSERRGDDVCRNVEGQKDQKLFAAGVKYFS